MANTPKRYSKILFQKGQADLVSAPFYVGDNRVALSAFANGTGLPPGARITFQEVVFVDGGRSDGSLCSPGQQHDSKQYDYKPFVSCGCEPALTERLSYMEIDRAGWYRAVYVGPSRASVMLTVMELGVQAGTGCCSKACCPIEVDLVIDKSVSSETIVSGDAGFFTIVMSNLGPDSSRGGSLIDALPAGLTYGVPSAVYAGGAQGSQPALAQLAAGDWHYTMIPPGGTITLTIPFTATSPGGYIPRTNTASIHPGIDEVDTNWVNNTDTVFYVITKPTADVSVTKSVADSSLKENDPFSYTVVVTNAGPRAADGTTVQDILPEGLVVNSIASAYAGGATGTTPTAAQLAAGFPITTLPAGGTATYAISGIAPEAGYYVNTAVAKVPTSVEDTDPTNNTAGVTLKVIARSANLAVEKSALDETLKEGDPFTFTVLVSNLGPDAADGATIKDSVPSGLTVGSIVASYSGGAAGPQPTTAQLAAGYVVPTFPAGGLVTLTISGVTTVAGFYLNFASAVPPDRIVDPDPNNNSDSAPITVVVRTVDLSVAKSANAASYAIGEPVIYTIAFANAGPDDANGAVLEDVLPASLDNVTVSVTFAGGAAAPVPTEAILAGGWVIPTLPSGGSGILTITGTATEAGILTNAVSISPPVGRNDTSPGNNNDLVVVTIRPDAFKTCTGELTTADTIFAVGSLMKCTNGVVEPLECGDIVKVLPNGCEPDCEANVWATPPGGSTAGAGVCIAVGAPDNYTSGEAVVQGRDLTTVLGGVQIYPGNPPAYLQHSYTNNTGCPVLYEAELVGRGNIFAWGQENASVAFTFNIGPTLGIPYPGNGSSQAADATLENTVRNIWRVNGVNEPSGQYSENSAGVARYRTILAPGQSTTVYGQWWCAFQEGSPLPGGARTIHGNMALAVRVTKGAAWL